MYEVDLGLKDTNHTFMDGKFTAIQRHSSSQLVDFSAQAEPFLKTNTPDNFTIAKKLLVNSKNNERNF